jgi:aryl-phospho-beta-D-glucosidase BglC (GH1 family)
MIKKFLTVFLLLCFVCCSVLLAEGLLKANGKNIVNPKGENILLRGINLGNWLIQEGYMMQTSSFANTETELRHKIVSLIGEANTNEFYMLWKDKYITKKDIDQIAKWGFNSIRLPLHFAKLTSKDQPNVFYEEGFATIDSTLKWCEQNKIYLILDLHAAPGSQNGGPISDSQDGKAGLWTNVNYQNRTIDLWKKIAERYATEEWVGGYDLINETAYNFPNNNNAPLWDLMIKITNEIRKVDKNHIVFIEGNWYATDFSALPSKLWDDNLVLSFHKYWNQTDVGTINYLINLRNQYNVPLWLGETGENSNAWFTECIELMEKYDIGYCFWPYKKIESISGLTTAPVSPQYQSLLNYWKNGGTKPSIEFAKNALFDMVKRLEFDNCIINKDVVDAMFRSVNNSTSVPYADNKVPGVINAVNYDMGKQGVAYSDKVYKNTSNNEAYNSGWSYRNDGVDIEKSSDIFYSNGYNVGWIELGEWLNYTLNVETTGVYDLNFRVAGANSNGIIIVRIDNEMVGDFIKVPNTGGYQSWQYMAGVKGLKLTSGTHKMQLQFLAPGFNLSTIEFSLITTDVEDAPELHEFELEQNYPNPSNPTTTINYQLPIAGHVSLKLFDALGTEVMEIVNEKKSHGRYSVNFDGSKLASGIYFYKLTSGIYSSIKKMIILK